MLELLQIQNLAIISDLTVEFRPGLNVITGETGAGKSIVLGALGLILGERAQTEVVRTGCERASLQAIFEVGDDERVRGFLEGAGLPSPDEGRVIVRREVQRAGKSRCQVNQHFVPVQTLAELGDLLVDFHGQHQHQSLLRAEEHLAIVDAAGGGHKGVGNNYRAAWASFDARRRELAALDRDDREQARRLDLLRFELEEIRAAAPEPGETERLTGELRRLANAEKLQRLAAEAYAALYEHPDNAPTAVELAGKAGRAVDELAALDPDADALAHALGAARVALDEAAFALRDYAGAIEVNQERLAEVQERLETLRRLRRKYGENEEEILAVADAHAAELDAAENADARRTELERQAAAARAEVERLAAELTKARTAAAAKLAKSVAAELALLNMKGTRLEVRRAALAEPGPDGVETMEFYLSANVGEEPRPLRKVASGGELSRIMLAIKTVDARQRRLPTMVFDEIDAGIGGVTADRVGEKLATLARRQQLLVITHLPHIAARGAHHLHVSKAARRGRTESQVAALEGEARVAELARMIGGEQGGRASADTARAMLRAQAS